MSNMNTCGHRWARKHELIVERFAKKWKVGKAVAFRRMIEKMGQSYPKV